VAEPVIWREADIYCKAAVHVSCGSGAFEVGMETLLVKLLVMSQGCEQVTGQEHELLVMSLVSQELFR